MGCVVLSAAFSFKTLTQTLRLDKIDLSYGLYLWHMLIIMSLLGIGWSSSRRLWFAVYGGGLLLAAISWFAVERPAQKLKGLTRLTTLKNHASHAPSDLRQSS
jgi:peptidoglycan/LPS O-acetylase OafA/YrhL